MRPREKNKVKKISEERIEILLEEAEKTFKKNPERAKRYCRLVFALVKKNKNRLTRGQKFSFCRKCFSFWKPGTSVKVIFDSRNHRLIYRCLKCGNERAIKYK
ncbi:hypothetical protein KJ780_02060 [Candidatus Micrarchaeota archaeon]|nr:hypothetical protein [Candidatus Micrarchaeota archaeon]